MGHLQSCNSAMLRAQNVKIVQSGYHRVNNQRLHFVLIC